MNACARHLPHRPSTSARPSAGPTIAVVVVVVFALCGQAAPACLPSATAAEDADNAAGVDPRASDGAAHDDPPAAELSATELAVRLNAADAAERLEAADALAALGEAARPAIPNLIRSLGDTDLEVRAACVEALGRMAANPSAVIPVLVAGLEQPTRTRRGPLWAVCATALGNYGGAALPHVKAGLDGPSPLRARAALVALDRVGPAAVELTPRLVEILRRNEPPTRILAINALRAIGPGAKAAIPELIRHLSSDDFHTQYWSCRALGAIGPEAHVAADELVGCLRTGVASVRRNAAAALGNIGPRIGPPAVAALIEALSDPSQPVRQNAVIALGQLEPLAAAAAPVIERLLREPARFTPRAPAAKTLWQLAPNSPTPAEALLRDLEADDEPWLAADLFAQINPSQETRARLAGLLDSPHIWTRHFAAVALLQLGEETQRAQAVLAELAERDEDLRQSAAQTLSRLKESPPQPR